VDADEASGDEASGDEASGDEASGNEAFFYTPEWQAAEREADDDLATGRYDDFETMADLIADLELEEVESSTIEA